MEMEDVELEDESVTEGEKEILFRGGGRGGTGTGGREACVVCGARTSLATTSFSLEVRLELLENVPELAELSSLW